MGRQMASLVRACKITGTDDHLPQNTLANCTCTVQRLSRRRSWCPQASWRHLRQTPILWPPSATHRPSCCSTDRLPSKIFQCAGHSWPLCCLQGIRPPDAGVLPTGPGWCSSLPPLSPRQNPEARPLPDWTWGQCRQSGSPPQLEQSLPTPQTDQWSTPPYARQPAPPPPPPTESASCEAKNATPTRRDAPFTTLGYPPEKVERHHLEIISVRTDCSMEFPPSLRRESGTCIKDLQGFKTRAYNHLKRQNWLWATDAL